MRPFVVHALFSSLFLASNEVLGYSDEHNSELCTHTVIVGGVAAADATGDPTPKLVYSPESIVAAVGDVVRFKFLQANHTATQSTFDDPCTKMHGGKDSGFMPNPEGEEGVVWDLTIDTEEPIWMYCKQGEHCSGGMVFAVNAAQSGDKTFAAFQQLAMSQGGGYGTDWANGTNAPVSSSISTATFAPTSTNPSASIVTGEGLVTDGSPCQCSCLCGSNDFPEGAAVGSYGGYVGMIPI